MGLRSFSASAPLPWVTLFSFSNKRYKRKGDSCLGINPKKQCISWEGTSTGKKHPHKRVERYFMKKNVGLMNIDGVAVSSQTAPPSSEPVSFIPVKDSDDAAPPVTAWLNPLGIYDRSNRHFGTDLPRSPGRIWLGGPQSPWNDVCRFCFTSLGTPPQGLLFPLHPVNILQVLFSSTCMAFTPALWNTS